MQAHSNTIFQIHQLASFTKIEDWISEFGFINLEIHSTMCFNRKSLFEGSFFANCIYFQNPIKHLY